MANYKQLTTIVPGWVKWCTVDADGEIWVWQKKPYARESRQCWSNHSPFSYCKAIGQGPKPKDWTQEIYELV